MQKETEKKVEQMISHMMLDIRILLPLRKTVIFIRRPYAAVISINYVNFHEKL